MCPWRARREAYAYTPSSPSRNRNATSGPKTSACAPTASALRANVTRSCAWNGGVRERRRYRRHYPERAQERANRAEAAVPEQRRGGAQRHEPSGERDDRTGRVVARGRKPRRRPHDEHDRGRDEEREGRDADRDRAREVAVDEQAPPSAGIGGVVRQERVGRGRSDHD